MYGSDNRTWSSSHRMKYNQFEPQDLRSRVDHTYWKGSLSSIPGSESFRSHDQHSLSYSISPTPIHVGYDNKVSFYTTPHQLAEQHYTYDQMLSEPYSSPSCSHSDSSFPETSPQYYHREELVSGPVPRHLVSSVSNEKATDFMPPNYYRSPMSVLSDALSKNPMHFPPTSMVEPNQWPRPYASEIFPYGPTHIDSLKSQSPLSSPLGIQSPQALELYEQDSVISVAMQLREDFITNHLQTSLPFNPGRQAKGNEGGTGKRTSYTTHELFCQACSDKIGNVVFRGKKHDALIRLVQTCLSCFGGSRRGGNHEQEGLEDVGMPVRDEVAYENTISAAIDRAADSILPSVELLPIYSNPAMISDLPPRMHSHAITCDVCQRIISAGEVISSSPEPQFTMEIQCAKCLTSYQACSDCGGGGGRLTSGRWRSTELFPPGRRTCRLSHTRVPALHLLENNIRRASEITMSEKHNLQKKCMQVYFNTRLSVIARPEILERGDGQATSFKQAENCAIDQWCLLLPLFQEDYDSRISRYVATQMGPNYDRRGSKNQLKNKSVETVMTGFVLAQVDWSTGAIYYASFCPWTVNGTRYDASQRLEHELLVRIRHDRHNKIAHKQIQLKPLTCIWTLWPFRRDSSQYRLLMKRGFMDKESFLERYPDIPSTTFAPYCQINVPVEFLNSYHLMIKPVIDQDVM